MAMVQREVASQWGNSLRGEIRFENEGRYWTDKWQLNLLEPSFNLS